MNPSAESATFRWDGATFSPSLTIAVADRGFRYGMMVFETIALRQSRALFLEAHLRRLQQAAALTGLSVPSGALAAVAPFLSLSDITGIARLHLTAGPGAFDAPSAAGEFFLTLETREQALPGAYRLDATPQPTLPAWPGTKTGNYWPNIRALGVARRAGCDEALLVSPNGQVIGAAMANLFAFLHDQLRTPRNARAGVIREWVMSRREVAEDDLSPADLADADEIFLTSSGLGVMSVSHFGNRQLSSRVRAGSLREEYEQAVL